MWAAVRRIDERLKHITAREVGMSKEEVKRLVREMKKDCPFWDEEYPVIDIIEVAVFNKKTGERII